MFCGNDNPTIVRISEIKRFKETKINEGCMFIEHSMRYFFVGKSLDDLVPLPALCILHPGSSLNHS